MCQSGPQTVKYSTEGMALRSEPPRKRPHTHAEFLGNRSGTHWSMRKQPSDCVLNARLQRTGLPSETKKRFFTEVPTKAIKVTVRCQNWIIGTGFWKNNFISVRAVLECCAHHFFYFCDLSRSVMRNADLYWTEIAVNQFAANTDERGYPKFDLVHICVTS